MVCLTEVDQSCGDFDHPEIEHDRAFSPGVQDVPIELRNLDKDDEDDLDVKSIRSVRLYRGKSPKQRKIATHRVSGAHRKNK